MLRSIRAGAESMGRGAVESAIGSFEWFTKTLPHAVVDSTVRIARKAQEKGEDFNQWAIRGYDERSQVIFTNERDFRINAVILEKKLNDMNVFEYKIKIIAGTYFMGDMTGQDTTADGVRRDYFREQILTVLHPSLRKGK